MADESASFLRAVREACSPAVWSRGVELTRANAVVAERQAADESVFRVTTRGGMICPRVTLYPADLDWHCECPSRHPACEHVAAAAIAWNRGAAAETGAVEAPAVSIGRVGYRFTRDRGQLAFGRVIVVGDEELPLEASLTAIASGRVDGPRFQATQSDLAVELALGVHRRGPLAPPLVPKLFARLEGCDDIRLDGRPVKVARQAVLPRVRVYDDGSGFRVRLEADPSVEETFRNGIALCDATLRVVREPALTGRERHELSQGKYFGPDAVGELVVDVLASLKSRLPVQIDSERLPETVKEPPRAQLDVSREGHTLSVLGTVVYGDPPTARVDGGRLVHLRGPVPLRDRNAERDQVRHLEKLGLVPGVRALFSGPEAVAFNVQLAKRQLDIRGEGLRHFDLAPAVAPRVSLDGSRLDLTFEVDPAAAGASVGGTGSAGADPAQVLQAWRSGESLVPLLDGGWAPLPLDWLNRFGHRVADLLAARAADGTVPRCNLPELADLCEELDQPVPAELAGLRELIRGFDRIPATSLPDDLTLELRPYQKIGVDWLVFLRDAGLGAMLADDMGLGKTIQALCAVRPRALVVAPTSVLHNWADEIRRHRPGLSVSVYHGPRRELDPDADVTLTTYAILRLDVDKLSRENWRTAILDEAQNIKNPDSRVAAAAFRLEADFRVTLTGTPVENRLEELWSQLHFTNPGLLGSRKDFQERYNDPIARGDADAARRLRARARPFILRRLKSEVARDLPPRTDMVLRCELADEERDVYDAIRAATLDDVVRRFDSGGGVLAALEALLRLRQAACHRGLVPGQQADDSSKLRLLLEALDNVVSEGNKALIFSQWTSLLDLTEPHLKAAGIDYLRLDGSTRDRGAVVRAFQTAGGPPVMLISLKAGGTGLNLTAADHVFLFDPWWNPAVEDQAADRAHRIGQRKPVMVYRLVSVGTVEERVLELQQRKRELADVALGEADSAARLTRDDLMELLS